MYTTLASMNAFTIAYSQSDLFGKLIMWSLILLSMVCWSVLLHKTWTIQHVNRLSRLFKNSLEKNQDSLLALDLTDLPRPKHRLIPHPFASIYASVKQKTIELLNKNRHFTTQMADGRVVYLTAADFTSLESHATAVISAQNQLLEKHLFLLSTVTTLAPFMGLLGTVWGILVTFAGLQESGSVSSNSSVLGGISTALATTVLGLIIAIPALVAYNYLKTSIRSYATDMDDFLTQLLFHLELQYRKVE